MICIRIIFFCLRQSILQIKRNREMMLASLLSIAAVMVILGIFLMIAANLRVFSESTAEQLDMVEIYLQDSIRDDQQKKLLNHIERMSCVESVSYISKDKAMETMKKRWGDRSYLLDGLSSNPLPASLQVHLKSIRRVSFFVRSIRGQAGIEDISCQKEEIRKLVRITRSVQAAVMAVILLLTILSVLIVSNTIRLTILARGNDISIMKYVGAADWFIRGPFLVEGVVIGVMSAVISALIMSGFYAAFLNRFSERMFLIFSVRMIPAGTLSVTVTLLFLVMGISIGASGSLLSMRKFLEA